ncbi:MAG: RlmE family RNA methyltransferase, partial [Pseudomonadota bacterium]
MLVRKMTDNPNDKSSRGLSVRVKTARKRSNSSTRWLQRQLNDRYVVKAKQDGYNSRAAYKIIELDEKFGFLQKDKKVVDLGAAPGGWSQVAAKKCGEGNVLATDLLEINPIAG